MFESFQAAGNVPLWGTKRKSKWLKASGQGSAIEDTEREQRASHMGLHPGADLVKERRQGSFQFLGKPCHCPITMATAGMPRMAQAVSRDIQAGNRDKEERKGNVRICGHMY